jgi:hypothetical protein
MGAAIQALERVVSDFQAFAMRSSVEISQLKAEVSAVPRESDQSTNLNPKLGQNIDRKV